MLECVRGVVTAILSTYCAEPAQTGTVTATGQTMTLSNKKSYDDSYLLAGASGALADAALPAC